jgi:hypothetical protein
MRLQEFADFVFPILKLDPSDGKLWVEGAFAIHDITYDTGARLDSLFFPASCLLLMGLANKPMSFERVEQILYWEYPHPHPIQLEEGIKEIHSLAITILSGLSSEGTVSLERIYGVLITIARIAALEGRSLSSLALQVAKTLDGSHRFFQVLPNYNKEEQNEEGVCSPTEQP